MNGYRNRLAFIESNLSSPQLRSHCHSRYQHLLGVQITFGRRSGSFVRFDPQFQIVVIFFLLTWAIPRFSWFFIFQNKKWLGCGYLLFIPADDRTVIDKEGNSQQETKLYEMFSCRSQEKVSQHPEQAVTYEKRCKPEGQEYHLIEDPPDKPMSTMRDCREAKPHSRNYMAEEPFNCTHCRQSFSGSSDLLVHQTSYWRQTL